MELGISQFYDGIMVKVDFKIRIREIRRQKSLRQVDLARKVGVFQSEISEIENGKRSRVFIWLERLPKP